MYTIKCELGHLKFSFTTDFYVKNVRFCHESGAGSETLIPDPDPTSPKKVPYATGSEYTTLESNNSREVKNCRPPIKAGHVG
jgi:hypothetical protein